MRGNDRKIDKIRRLCYVNREGFTPSLKTENRTLSPASAPSGCIQQSAGVADRVASDNYAYVQHIYYKPSPRTATPICQFYRCFSAASRHSPLKNPTKPPAGLHLVLCKAPPGALTGSPGGGDTSSAGGTGLPGTGASPADLGSVGTAAAPAQLAAAGMGVQQKLLLEQQEYPGRRDYPAEAI